MTGCYERSNETLDSIKCGEFFLSSLVTVTVTVTDSFLLSFYVIVTC
jgi:hypothetical protein